MARPALPAYTLGKIVVREHPTMPGMWQSRGAYRDHTNTRRDVTASGKSEAAAKRALQVKVERARTDYSGGDTAMNHATRVRDAVPVWLEYESRKTTRAGERLTERTVSDYTASARRYVLDYSGPHGIANLPLAQANNIGRIEAWLGGVADCHGNGAANMARKVLSGILALAERRDAIPLSVVRRFETPGASTGSVGDRKCVDPDCDYDCGRLHLDTGRAFTIEEVQAVVAAAAKSNADIADLVAFLFGTGCRINEALRHTEWRDVDLEALTVRIRGTKTAAADRTVHISPDLADVLTRRAGLFGTTGLVFGVTRYPSKMGNPRDQANVLTVLRGVLAAAGVPWAGSHTFRRTVATWLDDAGAGLGEIAGQLGHANTVTTMQYVKRKTAPSRAASVMTLPPLPPPALALVTG